MAADVHTVKDAVLRDNPSYLGKALETLNAGARVATLGEQGAWTQVKSGNLQGWLPNTALRAAAVSLGAGASRAASGAQASEVALAGKGFNRQVEAEYRASHTGADYAAVDMMENIVMPAEDCEKFLRAGREGEGR